MSKNVKKVAKIVDEELSSDSEGSDQVVQVKPTSKVAAKTTKQVAQAKPVAKKQVQVESEEESSDEEEIKLLSKKTQPKQEVKAVAKTAKDIIVANTKKVAPKKVESEEEESEEEEEEVKVPAKKQVVAAKSSLINVSVSDTFSSS